MGQLTKGPDGKISKQQYGEVGNHRPGYGLKITKKLNPFAYLVIGSIYTAAVVFTTLNIAKPDRVDRGFSYSETKIKEEVLQEVKNYNSTNAKIRVDNQMTNQLERFRDEMIAEVNRMNIKYIEMLENSESMKTKTIRDLADREPASVKIQKGKPIIYSKANLNVLKFVHRKEYKRAKHDYKIKRQNFMSKLDLTKISDQEKLKDFEDEMDISLYELRQKHTAQREEFEKNRYIVVQN